MQNYSIFGYICILVSTLSSAVFSNTESLYAIETVPDIVYVVNSTLSYVALSIASLTSKDLRNSALHQDGFFWLFACFNFLGLVFTITFIKETRGLTDVQKKSLYSEPGNLDTDQTEEEIIKPDDKFIQNIASTVTMTSSSNLNN